MVGRLESTALYGMTLPREDNAILGRAQLLLEHGEILACVELRDHLGSGPNCAQRLGEIVLSDDTGPAGGVDLSPDVNDRL